MLVRCPKCKSEFRLQEANPGERVVTYLCPGCEQIVHLDLSHDEVRSSSSSDSYRKVVSKRKTVLVADDAQLVLDLAEKVLSEAGYQVLLALDGAEAMRLVRELRPDAVVVDLVMPEMTGFDILREVRADEEVKGTPILAISEVYQDDVLGLLHDLGAQGFLEKKNLEESLVFRVDNLLASEAAE
jgi:CheY-like chemotaxis protein